MKQLAVSTISVEKNATKNSKDLSRQHSEINCVNVLIS